MPGWNNVNAHWCEKPCGVCGILFMPKSGVHKFCSAACRGKWQYISGRQTTAKQYEEISGNWNRYLSRLCQKSFRREAISVDDCLAILERQQYRCALTGEPLTCQLQKGVRCKTNASLDQIEPKAGYTKDNVQLVCAAVNSFRNDLCVEEFINWCRKVVTHAIQK
jgi:hypothetical protein